MPLDKSYIDRNRASTGRIRALAARLSDQQMQTPVGEHWTVAIALAHLAFWDRRVMYVLDVTERGGTRLTITQGNNASQEETEQSSKFWGTILEGMKKLLERQDTVRR